MVFDQLSEGALTLAETTGHYEAVTMTVALAAGRKFIALMGRGGDNCHETFDVTQL